jgi:hypothetical protein
MTHHGMFSPRPTELAVAAAIALIACNRTNTIEGTRAALSVQCEPEASIPEGAWVCPEPLTLECGTADAATIYVAESDELSCADGPLSVESAAALRPGTHDVIVRDSAGDSVCEAELIVRDTAVPAIESHTVQLWPPNHKFHNVAVADCVSAVDACDGELRGEFIWASSDEPIDDIGDGHHAPDIGLSADRQHVCVRSERQGPKDGRVYKLGVRVVDQTGNAAEGECLVIVDHDQRGVTGKDSGEAYRVQFDGSEELPGCAGTPNGTGGSGGMNGVAGMGDGSAGSPGSAGNTGSAGRGDQGEAGTDEPPPPDIDGPF